MDLELILTSVVICLFGLPHGALDPVIAHQHQTFVSRSGAALFHLIYLLCSLLMIQLWVFAPMSSLALFLAYSAIHFGRDWSKIPLGGLPYGLIVLSSPAMFYPVEVASIFSVITFGGDLESAVSLSGLITPLVFTVLLITRSLTMLCGLELIFLILTAYLCSPLVYFTIYFCALHSPKHLYGEFTKLSASMRKWGLIVMSVITALTLLIVATFAIQLRSVVSAWDDFAYQAIFIGLASLTVPHMILIEWIRAKSRPRLATGITLTGDLR